MPDEPDDGADDQPDPLRRRARLERLVELGVGERRREEVVQLRAHARDLQEAADDRQHRQGAHRDLHRRGLLGDVVLRAGEADLGVLDLAGRRVGRLRRVVEVPVGELLGLRALLAVEGAEDHPERVDRGHERAQVAGHAEDRVPAAALELQREDLVLGEEARERRDARQREAADDHAPYVNGITLRKPDIRLRSWLPPIAAMTEPAAMKSSALKNACVIRWNMPAAYAAEETAMIM